MSRIYWSTTGHTEKTSHYPKTPLEGLSRAATPSKERQDSSTSSDTDSEYHDHAHAPDENSSTSGSLPLNHHSPDKVQAQDSYDHEQDAYISALDHQASLREEKRLWIDILRREPLHLILPEEVDIPKEPVPQPKPLEDIVDWRRAVSYAAEWETLESLVP